MDVLKIIVTNTDSSLLVTEVTVGRYGVMLVLSLSRFLGKVETVGSVVPPLDDELESSRAVNISVLSLSGSDTGTLVANEVFSKGVDEDRSLAGVGSE